MWSQLATHLTQESAILCGRVDANALRHMHKNGNAVVRVRDSQIVGFAALYETDTNGWFELGSVWVQPECRDLGIASSIFADLVKLASDRRVFTITHNPKIVHLAKKAGFVEATSSQVWLREVPFAATCGPCDRVKQKQGCPLLATYQCRLFYF